MRVDETGRNSESVQIDPAGGSFGCKIADFDDTAVTYADGSAKCRLPAAVDDVCVFEDQVKHAKFAPCFCNTHGSLNTSAGKSIAENNPFIA